MIRVVAATCPWVLVVLLFAAPADAQLNPSTPDHGLQKGIAILEQQPEAYRALPSVFIVNSIANGTLYCPMHVECNQQALDDAYSEAVTAGAVPTGYSEAAFKWIQAASEPDKYLRASSEMQAIELHDAVLGHGTAYAVSREGILLTNRHVIDNDVIMPFGFDVEPVGFERLILHGIETLGAWDGDSLIGSLVAEELEKWYASKCDRSKVTDRLAIAAAYQEEAVGNQLDASVIATQMALKQFGQDTRKPIFIPVEVIAKGEKAAENELVNDIAVLRIQGNVNDSLVCLPLAEDGEVGTGVRIYSLGFPGYKYDLNSGQLTGLYKVNVEPGSISGMPGTSLAARVLRHGLVTLNAKLRQGCSGGPIILTNGRVAAMNVAHRPAETFKDTQFLFPLETTGLAVSLSEIKKLLDAHGITLDVGPTTKLWNEAFDDYLNKNYAAAATKLQQVAEAQQFRSGAALSLPQPIVNQYVHELLELCEENEQAR